MLFLVEYRLVQMRDGPAFGYIELEQVRQLFVRFAGAGIAPCAERYEKFAIFVKSQVSVHHCRKTERPDSSKLCPVFPFKIISQAGICILKAGPDIIQ